MPLLQDQYALGAVPNKLTIEGHTDSHPFSAGGTYGNWELSSDRANVTRRLMQSNGVRADQVSQVRGYADQRLRKIDDPKYASNRRVSIIVHYITKPDAEDAPGGKESAGKSGEAAGKPGEAGGTSAKPLPTHAEAPAKAEAGESKK
jgi:chemotaxis protein MotB